MKMPGPECRYGFPRDQLEWLIGPRRMQEFDLFMTHQTAAYCDGKEWNYRESQYEATGCGPHGAVYYPQDVERFLELRGDFDGPVLDGGAGPRVPALHHEGPRGRGSADVPQVHVPPRDPGSAPQPRASVVLVTSGQPGAYREVMGFLESARIEARMSQYAASRQMGSSQLSRWAKLLRDNSGRIMDTVNRAAALFGYRLALVKVEDE